MLTQRSSTASYDLQEKSPKKEKRWSFGNLFRRKKKSECGASSSDEGHDNKKKKSNKQKQNVVIGYDRIIVPTASSRYKTQSEPYISNNFIPASSFTTRYVPLKDSQENIDRYKPLGSPQVNSLGRSKKETIKARAEARRDTSKGEDSSDEDSQKSAFRSDESLTKYKDGSLSKKSRAARTQRYLKRRSRDEEFNDQLRPCKSDVEHDYFRKFQNVKPAKTTNICHSNSTASSKSSFSGLSTIPPSHSRYKNSNLTNGYIPKYDYNDITNRYTSQDLHHQRSLSCGAGLQNGGKHHRNPHTRQPPAPPPRDPKRSLGAQNCEDRPNSFTFENGYHSRNGSDQNLPNYRSISEDHIPSEQNHKIPLVPRSASAISNGNHVQKSNTNHQKLEEPTNGYCYFTDKSPRSRRPISIQQNNESQKSFDFWRQKDEAIARSNYKSSNPESPIMFTAQTHVRTTTFLPNGVTIQTDSAINTPADDSNRVISPFRPITPVKSPSLVNIEPKEETMDDNERPSNFEDALDELEAIYNSLHLGDEDLLERAEQREAAAAQKRRDALFESFPNSIPYGTVSDSSYGYDLNPLRHKCYSKKTKHDRKADDMAFRKLNKDHTNNNNTSDSQNAASKISYLLTSPVFNKPYIDHHLVRQTKRDNKEPDITLDDVVYRNVKHTNDTLKIEDPQLPFGIPVGPISPACNSDYLHAMPENTRRSMFKPKKIPDVVKDDLAYRNLRKDPNKEPALPQVSFSPEEYRKAYNNKSEINLKKKKKPVRSLSANISKLLGKDHHDDIDEIADALETSRRAVREKENEISEIRKAFMSDGELTYRRLEDEEAQIKQSAIDDLLSSLAVETDEANECIANELKIYDEEKKLKKALADSLSSKDIKKDMLKELEKESLNLQLPKVDSTSEHTKLCEKLLECVVESTELLAMAKVESDPSEEVDGIQVEPLLQETVANIVLTPGDQSKILIDPVSTEIFSESDDAEIDNEVQELLRVVNDGGVSGAVSVSPLEKHKAELLAAFEELRMPESGGLNVTRNGKNVQRTDKGGGEESVSVQNIALPVKEGCAFISETYFEFDENVCWETKPASDCLEFCSTFELDVKDSLIELAQESAMNLEDLGNNSLQVLPESSKDTQQSHNNVGVSCDIELAKCESLQDDRNNSQLDLRHTPEPSRFWYEDPAIVAFACSCGIACTTQLPNLDIVAVLGLFFAIILLSVAFLARF